MLMINSIKPIICSGGSMNGMPMMKIDFADVLDESALTGFQKLQPEQVFSQIIEGWKHPWVQFSGKEPCSQQGLDFVKLMKMLIKGGYHVHLETWGSLPIPCIELFRWITLIAGYPEIEERHPAILGSVHEIQFLVDSLADLDWICNTIGDGAFGIEQRKPVIQIHPMICVGQKAKSPNGKFNVPYCKPYYPSGMIDGCKELCLKNGWNLSIDSMKLAME